MPTATIQINIKKFVPGGCCGIDRPTIQSAGGNRVSFKTDDPNDPHFHTIVVKSKGRAPLDLEFAITPEGEYVANAIAFTQTNGAHDPKGNANFKNHARKGHTLRFTNVFAHSGKGREAPHWDYTIAVTQIATGLATTIDPGIENSEQE